MPQVMIPFFHLDAQQLSLQYISIIIGSILVKSLLVPFLIGGWREVLQREIRLWVCYKGYLLVSVGLIIWGVFLYKAEPGNWTIKPLIGAAIAAASNNIVTTFITTFAVDNAPAKADDVDLYINFVGSLYGFLGPFYFHYMFQNLNFAGSAGLMSALVAVFAFGPTVLAHIVGLRRA